MQFLGRELKERMERAIAHDKVMPSVESNDRYGTVFKQSSQVCARRRCLKDWRYMFRQIQPITLTHAALSEVRIRVMRVFNMLEGSSESSYDRSTMEICSSGSVSVS